MNLPAHRVKSIAQGWKPAPGDPVMCRKDFEIYGLGGRGVMLPGSVGTIEAVSTTSGGALRFHMVMEGEDSHVGMIRNCDPEYFTYIGTSK